MCLVAVKLGTFIYIKEDKKNLFVHAVDQLTLNITGFWKMLCFVSRLSHHWTCEFFLFLQASTMIASKIMSLLSLLHHHEKNK
jgi:hypothetical protein